MTTRLPAGPLQPLVTCRQGRPPSPYGDLLHVHEVSLDSASLHPGYTTINTYSCKPRTRSGALEKGPAMQNISTLGCVLKLAGHVIASVAKQSERDKRLLRRLQLLAMTRFLPFPNTR